MATSLLFACTGDDGPPGPQGETGSQGPQGEQGEQGASGANGAVPASSAERINIIVTKVTIADDPDTGTSNAATVEFTLLNDLTQGLFGIPTTSVSFVLSQLTPAEAGSGAAWAEAASPARKTKSTQRLLIFVLFMVVLTS